MYSYMITPAEVRFSDVQRSGTAEAAVIPAIDPANDESSGFSPPKWYWRIRIDRRLCQSGKTWRDLKKQWPQIDLLQPPTAHEYVTCPDTAGDKSPPHFELDINYMPVRYATKSNESAFYDYFFVNKPKYGRLIEYGRVRTFLMEEHTVGLIITQWPGRISTTWVRALLRAVSLFNKSNKTWKIREMMRYEPEQASVTKRALSDSDTPPENKVRDDKAKPTSAKKRRTKVDA